MYILIGAGGHSKVVISILRRNNETIVGIIDDNRMGKWGEIDILGNVSQIPTILKKYPHAKYIVTIGDNGVREKITTMCKSYPICYGNAIDPSAIIGEQVYIGEGSVVMPGAVINSDVQIGRHSIINTSASVDHDCIIGDFVHISPGVNLAGNVKVGNLSHIGIGSCSIQNILIGQKVIVGAGATVINNIEDNLRVVGTPAIPLEN